MGRLSKIPVEIPDAVTVDIGRDHVKLTGPKGSLGIDLPRFIEIFFEDGLLRVASKKETKEGRALSGTMRALLANMAKGVTEGWERELEVNGPRYRAEVQGDDLRLSLGYSHPVIIKAPPGISFKVEKSFITVSGIDKQLVGEVSAKIREARRPNIYKGTGVRYKGEHIKLKPGKQASGAGSE